MGLNMQPQYHNNMTKIDQNSWCEVPDFFLPESSCYSTHEVDLLRAAVQHLNAVASIWLPWKLDLRNA